MRIKFIDAIIFKILEFFNGILGNYGLAIIATTILIKIVLLPLSIKQEQHMRLQSELQPKINALNKKYPKKGPEYNKELTDLYKQENANPLLGCLPILIQLPVFIGLYNTFRNANFVGTNFLWFNLTKPDHLFSIGNFSVNLLPILAAVFQVLQTKLMSMGTTQPDDDKAKAMQKTMYIMPILLLLFFYNLSSALNLYFVVNILLSLIQTYVFMLLRKKKEK